MYRSALLSIFYIGYWDDSKDASGSPRSARTVRILNRRRPKRPTNSVADARERGGEGEEMDAHACPDRRTPHSYMCEWAAQPAGVRPSCVGSDSESDAAVNCSGDADGHKHAHTRSRATPKDQNQAGASSLATRADRLPFAAAHHLALSTHAPPSPAYPAFAGSPQGGSQLTT